MYGESLKKSGHSIYQTITDRKTVLKTVFSSLPYTVIIIEYSLPDTILNVLKHAIHSAFCMRL